MLLYSFHRSLSCPSLACYKKMFPMQSCLLLSKGIENFVGFCQFLKTNYFLQLQDKECTSFCEKENTALFPNVSSNLVLLQSKNKQAEAEYRYWHQDFTVLTEGLKAVNYISPMTRKLTYLFISILSCLDSWTEFCRKGLERLRDKGLRPFRKMLVFICVDLGIYISLGIHISLGIQFWQ